MSAIRKMSMWLDGVGWLTPFHLAETPEGGTDPEGTNVPQIPGTQRMYADGEWYYLTSPANLATMIQAGTQSMPGNPTSTAPNTSVSLNPMAMMSQMLPLQMMQQMLRSMGVSTEPQEQKPPLDLSQLSGPAAIIGEKIKETVLGGIQLWKALKG